MGASGMGKSTLLFNLGYLLWEFGGANVSFYSLEMPLTQVMPVLVTTYERMMQGKTEFEMRALMNTIVDSVRSISGNTESNMRDTAEIKEIDQRLRTYTGEIVTDQKRFRTGLTTMDDTNTRSKISN